MEFRVLGPLEVREGGRSAGSRRRSGGLQVYADGLIRAAFAGFKK